MAKDINPQDKSKQPPTDMTDAELEILLGRSLDDDQCSRFYELERLEDERNRGTSREGKKPGFGDTSWVVR